MCEFTRLVAVISFVYVVFFFHSCEKENILTTVITEDDFQIDTIVCGLQITLSTVNMTGESTISTNVTGGTEPYSYSWSEGSTTANLTVFSNGEYAVTVTDALGCVRAETMAVEQIDCIPYNVLITSQDSSGSTYLFAQISGGTPPYQYLWSQDSSITPDLFVTTPGTYFVTVTDSNGCTEEDDFQL